MAIGGAILRVVQTLLRVIQLCCAIVACGIFAYYLAVLADHDLPIETYVRAVTGMSGAAIIYTAFAVLLTLCFAGVAFLAYIAVFLDICFIGCFAAIAYFSRGGAGSCSGEVNTPIGSGSADSAVEDSSGEGSTSTNLPSFRRACMLETAVFAVSIVAIFLFIVTAVLQVLLVRHHKKEKRYGPSPSNNYTSGAGRRPFWKRKNRHNKHNNRDAELATAPGAMGTTGTTGTTGAYGRPSHETGYTDTTMVGGGGGANEPKYGHSGYGAQGTNAYHYGHNNAATNY